MIDTKDFDIELNLLETNSVAFDWLVKIIEYWTLGVVQMESL